MWLLQFSLPESTAKYPLRFLLRQPDSSCSAPSTPRINSPQPSQAAKKKKNNTKRSQRVLVKHLSKFLHRGACRTSWLQPPQPGAAEGLSHHLYFDASTSCYWWAGTRSLLQHISKHPSLLFSGDLEQKRGKEYRGAARTWMKPSGSRKRKSTKGKDSVYVFFISWHTCLQIKKTCKKLLRHHTFCWIVHSLPKSCATRRTPINKPQFWIYSSDVNTAQADSWNPVRQVRISCNIRTEE